VNKVACLPRSVFFLRDYETRRMSMGPAAARNTMVAPTSVAV
jgi:hypothetical protein